MSAVRKVNTLNTLLLLKVHKKYIYANSLRLAFVLAAQKNVGKYSVVLISMFFVSFVGHTHVYELFFDAAYFHRRNNAIAIRIKYDPRWT